LNIAAEKKQKREHHHDASQIGMGVNAYPGVYGAPQVSYISASLHFFFFFMHNAVHVACKSRPFVFLFMMS